MKKAEKRRIEEYINREWKRKTYFRLEEGEYELAERCYGEVLGAMQVLNELGYYCTRKDENSDWEIVEIEV